VRLGLSNNRSMREKVTAIADDLTGANELGLIFKKNGINPIVAIDFAPDRPFPNFDYDSVVINLETRRLNPKRAYEKIKHFLERHKFWLKNLVYKKIDSTVRGNLAEELDPFFELDMADVAAVVPALPYNGRITVGGYHLVNGIPIIYTEYAKDQGRNIEESYLPFLIQRFSHYKVSHITLIDVLKGWENIDKQFVEHFKKGNRIIVLDATNNTDLERIACAIKTSKLKILPVGSAGLMEKLYSEKKNIHAMKKCIEKKPVLFICGSLNEISRIQVRQLIEERGYETRKIELNVKSLINSIGKKKRNEFNRLLDQASIHLDEGKNLVICTPEEKYGYRKNKDLINESTKSTLGLLAKKLLERNEISGLFLIGGDTALAVLGKLGAQYFGIGGQLVPYVPVGVIKSNLGCDIRDRGFKYKKLIVITKAGGFGDKDILVKGAEYFQKNS